MNTQTPEALVKDITAAMATMKETQAQLNAELSASVKKTGDDVTKALAQCDELASKMQKTAASIVEMEQKLSDNVQTGKAAVETLGQMVVKSDAFKQYVGGNAGNKMQFKANTIIGQDGSPLENSSTIVAPQRLPGIIPGAFRLLRVADVIPQGVTSSNMIEYTRELAFTNNAAERNEGTQKPESVLTFELKSSPVATIAHLIKASKQVLEDAPMLASYIDTRMRYGVNLRLDNQLLNGDGTIPNISGILDAGNHVVFTPQPGENALDSVNRAIYEVYAADYAPTAIIMNPADWGAIERLKVGPADDRYVIGNPQGIIGPQLWGLPVVVTNNCPQGTFVVGAMDIAYQLWNRTDTVVEIFEQDTDNVQKNLLTIRAERRAALATYRPASVRAGLLTATGT